MNLSVCILLIGFLVCQSNGILKQKFELNHVATPNSTYLEGFFNISTLRIGKFNRTTYALYLEVEVFADLDENIEMEIKYYYNRINNNQYNLMPIRFKRVKVCDLIEQYKSLLDYEEFRNITNIPEPDMSKPYCPVKPVRITRNLYLKKKIY